MVPESFLRRYALFFGGHDVERHDGQNRAVHGHGDRHRIERNTLEELPHIEDRVDRHPGHADIPRNPRMIGIITPVGGEIEGHRQALLTGRQVAAIEGVRGFGRGEAGILPDGPGLGRVHGRIGAAQERRQAGIGSDRIEAGPVRGAVGGA